MQAKHHVCSKQQFLDSCWGERGELGTFLSRWGGGKKGDTEVEQREENETSWDWKWEGEGRGYKTEPDWKEERVIGAFCIALKKVEL